MEILLAFVLLCSSLGLAQDALPYADEVVAEPGLYVFKLSYNTEIGTRRQLDGLVHLLR